MPSSIKPARPTIAVAGQEQAVLAERLVRLVIHESTSGLFGCEALFGNWGAVAGRIDFLYFDRKLFDFGKPFAIRLDRDTVFEGRITGLEANFPEGRPPELAVLAEDRLQDLRMTRRTRTFADVSDADVMRTVAADHGLSPSIDVSGPTHKVLAQVNQSDLAFLRERARAIDAELWMTGRTLNAKSRSNRSGAALRLAFGHELREFSALSDLAGQRTSVSVSGWDVSSKSAFTHEASESAVGGEVGGDASGVSILRSALGDRKEAVVHGVPLNSQETAGARRGVLQGHRAAVRHRARRGRDRRAAACRRVRRSPGARSAVQRQVLRRGSAPSLRRRRRSADRIHGGAAGHRPRVTDMVMLEQMGLDPLVDERVPSGLGGRWYGVYPALVTDIKDPDGQGRVKVTLPWSPDTGGARYEAWARLATLMGGNNRGSWFVPDVNDEVLVAFEGGDTRRPYVVGALWNGSDTPPDSMDGGGRTTRRCSGRATA